MLTVSCEIWFELEPWTKWQQPHDPPHTLGIALKPGRWTLFGPGTGWEHDVAGELIAPNPLLIGRSPDGGWRCIAHLALTDRDELVIFRLEVVPWDDDVIGLGTAALANLPLHRWLVAAHSRLSDPGIAAWFQAKGAQVLTPGQLAEVRRDAKRLAKSTPPKPGPKGFGEAYYRRLALEYLELQPKIGRGIRIELADRETKRQNQPVTPLNIRDALNKATELGFLAKGTRGRAGRMPGPNLYPTSEED